MALSIDNKRVPSSSAKCGCIYFIRMTLWKLIKWFPVLLILSVVSWSYYAYVYQLCINTVNDTIQTIVFLVLYHLVLFMFIWSYYQTVMADIKPVPELFRLPERELEKLLSCDSEEQQREYLENFAKELPLTTRTNSGCIRYCNRCVLIKPDRAHHCSICAKCVLKMDHHCPWVNNCVCYFNYKFFMLFLGYGLVYCLFVIFTTLPFFIKFWKHQIAEGGGPGQYHIVFLFFIASMFSISLGPLFGYHCYLVSRNRTTLDMLIKLNKFGPSQRIVSKLILTLYNEAFRAPMFRGGADKNGFSIGAYSNFKEVFGNNPNLWLVPVFTSLGDGCQYPVRDEHQLRTFSEVPQEQHSYESMGTTRPRSEQFTTEAHMVNVRSLP